ncbi:MAG: DNA methyltransferase, partial [Myxococcota bacterium]|nr:DNA methyltransferase [Myxococcota bacterium]
MILNATYSPSTLSSALAQKARTLRDHVEQEILREKGATRHRKVGQSLLHLFEHQHRELSRFADGYAQTVCYGLLAARWMSLGSARPFTVENIPWLLPSTSGVLKGFFLRLFALPSPSRVRTCLVDIASFVSDLDLSVIFSDATDDPIIHFYEDFLDVYEKSLKKERGVYYTPDAVVDFMIRAVDERLRGDFGLPLGLASVQRWDVVSRRLQIPIPEGVKEGDVFVRILDPATGTGTYLKGVVTHIRTTLRHHWRSLGYTSEEIRLEWCAYLRGEQGQMADYRGQGLLSRLFGFEVMMAPYVIAHLRLGLLLQNDPEMPFVFNEQERWGIFLTNALSRFQDAGTHEDFVSQESSAAESVKAKTPITVMVGNPPYSGESGNNGADIMRLMEDYKKEPGGRQRLLERNPKWVNNDYVKFFRFAQSYTERFNAGICAFINPHGFLDNPTFRGVRWSLWNGYSQLYILDLHGNLRKKERAADGSKDENIFAIQEGVSINVFLKNRLQNGLGSVYHHDLLGLSGHKLQ